MSKVIFSGLESSGKSLKLAMVASDILHRNAKWKEKTGITRPIASNLEFSKLFQKEAELMQIPIIIWRNLTELVELQNADVFIDEVGNYFDARLWADLPLDVRMWLSQGAKSGIEIYGSAQDFAQVDKSFRRLCNELYEITKVIGSPRPSATKPPVKKIWGVCMMRGLDPRAYNEDKKKFSSSFELPHFFFIQKVYCDMFDTTQKIKRSSPMPYRHEERFCELDDCPMHGKKSGRAKLIHV